MFHVNNVLLDPTKGDTVDGVLVVFDSEQVFNTNFVTDIRCVSAANGGITQQAIVFLDSEYIAAHTLNSLSVMLLLWLCKVYTFQSPISLCL